jgi:4-amino-4-deoxy-L-arabinose transferase-like glycosyltransferase
VLAVAVVARVLYWVLITPHYVPVSDAAQYQQIAHSLATGRGFDMTYPQLALHPTAFRPPVYPAILAVAFWLTGSALWAGRLLNLLIGVGVVALSMRTGQLVANRRAGLVAGLAVALYPPLIANDVVLLSEPVSLLLILGMVLALGRRRVALAGVLCGLLILARPSAQGIALVVGAWLIWQVGWRRCAQFLVVAGLVISPWVVRNWVQMGSPVLVTSNGYNEAAIYSPVARQAGGFVDPVFNPAFARFRLAQFNEVGWQRDLQHLALASIRQHPSQVPRVVARNTAALLELKPSYGRQAEIWDGRNLTFVAWTMPLFYLVTLVGLVGLGLGWKDSIMKLLAFIAGYFLLTSLFLVAPPRLRAPFDLVCCIGVGVAVDAALRRYRRDRAAQVSA